MTIEDVENLAELAKLELTDNEKEKILKDMEGILSYVKQIEEVNLPIEAGARDIEQEYLNRNVWREDVVRSEDADMFLYDLIIKQFPDSQNGFVKVKKIL
ncbi:MAG: Asp-tRNA(Asn)/Glu-tRNA(Gln) amidotransferase subunit GatC [Patescibacteria group bacterium]